MENSIKCSAEKHSQKDAVYYCQECSIYMCNQCENYHSKLY